MKPVWLALAVCALLSTSAHAEDSSAADDIRAGRAALEAEHPDAARTSFEAALARADLSQGDRFAALVGLGRADIWIGDYPASVAAYREALSLAASDDDTRTANIGMARALNADEYYYEAYKRAAPFASGSLEPTVEVLRAEKALGWEDKSTDVVAALPPDDIQGRIGRDFARLKADMDFALSDRVDGSYSFSNDSDGLTLMGYGLGAWIPGSPGGNFFESLRAASNVWTVDDSSASYTVSSFSVGSLLRIGDAQHADFNLGGANVGSWNFFEGNADWNYRLDDNYSANASIDRSPILTTTAIANRELFTTYALGVGVRPSDHWYVYPAYVHQDFTDGNERNGASLRVVLSPYDIADTDSAIGAQVFARIFHSSLPSTGIYFNPANYNQAQFDLIGVHRIDENWTLRAVAGGGYQNVNGAGAPSYDIDVALIGRLPGNGRAEIHAGRNSFASFAGGGSNYWVNTVSISVAYPVGF
jgi:hypothetical protein